MNSSAVFTLACLLIAVLPACADNSSYADAGSPLALHDVNELIRKNYSLAKEEIRQGLGPIIIATPEAVTLLKPGPARETVFLVKPRYTGLKEVSHLTLGTFVLLANHTDENLSEKQLERLRQFKASIEQSASKIKQNEGLVPDDYKRQEKLVHTTLSFLSKGIDEKRVSKADLKDFARSTAVGDMENAYEAASVQLSSLDEVVAKWREAMTAAEWRNLHVIIMTSHMPRQNSLLYQYFAKILGQKKEGERIIIAEGLAKEEDAIDLLLTHILDRKVATNFFGDPWRMHRDLLSDGAAKYLKQHKIQGILPGK